MIKRYQMMLCVLFIVFIQAFGYKPSLRALSIPIQNAEVTSTTSNIPSIASSCMFQMNGPVFQASDGNLIGISNVPVRDYYVRFNVFPRALVVSEHKTSLIELSTTSLQDGPNRIPSVDFLSNSTRMMLSFITDAKSGVGFIATEELPLQTWSEISIYISGSTLTLVALNAERPFANRIKLSFSRHVVNSIFIYAGSTSFPAANVNLKNFSICANPSLTTSTFSPSTNPSISPTVLPTSAPVVITSSPTVLPSPMPTLSPTAPPSPQPTANPTEQPTAEATVVLTIYVPAPTSSPTPGLPAFPTIVPIATSPPSAALGNQGVNQVFGDQNNMPGYPNTNYQQNFYPPWLYI